MLLEIHIHREVIVFKLKEFQKLENLIYCNGELYSEALNEPEVISVCYTTKIKILPLSQWNNPRPHNKVLNHVILHKRHTKSGFSHILGDELFQLFYITENVGHKIDGILNLENLERSSYLATEWPDWIESYLDQKVFRTQPTDEPVLIRNAYAGWLNIHHISKQDPDFDRMKFVKGLKKRYGADSKFIRNKIIFETRETKDPRYARSANRRQIINFDELKVSLADFNIEFISLGDLSVKEQIGKVASAQLFIGQHGAAICNSIFMSPGSTVIEILPWDHKYNGFIDLSKLFGISHQLYHEVETRCYKRENLIDNSKFYVRDQNIEVNPVCLREYIERALKVVPSF